jgi:hypothetical protein
MDALTAAATSATAVSTIGSHFMLDPATFAAGTEAGFSGFDFYFAGRGGALGDVSGDVVAAAFTFFEPGMVRTQWDLGRQVMAPADSAKAFTGCLETWAAAKVSDDVDVARLAELAAKVAAGTNPAAAPMFAGWRAVEAPADPKAAAVFQMNVLRELRNGLHGAAVMASGLTPAQAVAHRSPHMAPLFGWGEVDMTGVPEVWDGAEAATDVAMAHAFETLDDAERAEFTELANQLHTTCA